MAKARKKKGLRPLLDGDPAKLAFLNAFIHGINTGRELERAHRKRKHGLKRWTLGKKAYELRQGGRSWGYIKIKASRDGLDGVLTEAERKADTPEARKKLFNKIRSAYRYYCTLA